jgi:Mor family transcriptional regulator
VEIANDLAESACNRILEDLGGDCHYLPRKDTYARNAKITAEYNGKNIKELQVKYYLSERTIKRIIRAD